MQSPCPVGRQGPGCCVSPAKSCLSKELRVFNPRAYLEQANEQFSPIAKRLHTEFMDLLTQLVETGKKAVQQ